MTNKRKGDDERRNAQAEKFREKVEELQDGARKIGLYLEDAGVVPGPDDAFDKPTMVLVCNFNVGDQAWSTRVQEGADFEKMETNVKQLEREMDQSEFDALRDRLARGEVFKSDDEEGTE